MKAKATTLVSGIALLAPASIGLFLTGFPTVLAPLPALTIIPAFAFGPGAVALPAMLFFAWNPELFQGRSEMPKRTYVLFLVATALDIAWFATSWKFGLRYQGPVHTYAVCALNAAWIVLLGAMIIRTKMTTPSFAANLILHWLLFAWLGWSAFPYLGELP